MNQERKADLPGGGVAGAGVATALASSAGPPPAWPMAMRTAIASESMQIQSEQHIANVAEVIAQVGR